MVSTGKLADLELSVLLPDAFDGSGDFVDWISHFESVSAVNKWSGKEKLLRLGAKQTGKAPTWHILAYLM